MPRVFTRDLTNQTDLVERDTQLSKVSSQLLFPDNISMLDSALYVSKALYDHIILKKFLRKEIDVEIV